MSKIVLSTLLLMTTLLFPLSQYVKTDQVPAKLHSFLKNLEKESGGSLEVAWNKQTNTPSKLTGSLSPVSKHSPEWIAYEFLNKWKMLYGLQDPRRNMEVTIVERNSDNIKVHLQHLLFRIPVWEDGIVIEIGYDGVIRQIEGTIHPNLEKQSLNRPMHPAISKKQAIDTATAMIRGKLAAEPEVSRYYLSARSGTPLVYAVRHRYHNPDRTLTTLIHSLTGRIIESK